MVEKGCIVLCDLFYFFEHVLGFQISFRANKAKIAREHPAHGQSKLLI